MGDDCQSQVKTCVKIGNTVTVTIEPHKILTITITTPQEIDPLRGAVSYESPIGKAVFGKHEGDVFQYSVGSKIFKGKVMKIHSQEKLATMNL